MMRAAAPLLMLLGSCGDASAPAERFSMVPVAAPLPADDEFFEGPDADLLNAQCTACHGATMVTYQPRQSAAGWAKTVAKMREVYKAPIAEEEVPGIVRALAALSAE
jgi:cytochrome c5